MLPVGVRFHRENAERRYLAKLDNWRKLHCVAGQRSQSSCKALWPTYLALELIIKTFLNKKVYFNEILHFFS